MRVVTPRKAPAAAEATGPALALALGVGAAVLRAAGLAMALTAHRLARLTAGL
jgi:hypothetical protein